MPASRLQPRKPTQTKHPSPLLLVPFSYVLEYMQRPLEAAIDPENLRVGLGGSAQGALCLAPATTARPQHACWSEFDPQNSARLLRLPWCRSAAPPLVALVEVLEHRPAAACCSAQAQPLAPRPCSCSCSCSPQFIEARLDRQTAELAHGCAAVCLFVNDACDGEVRALPRASVFAACVHARMCACSAPGRRSVEQWPRAARSARRSCSNSSRAFRQAMRPRPSLCHKHSAPAPACVHLAAPLSPHTSHTTPHTPNRWWRCWPRRG